MDDKELDEILKKLEMIEEEIRCIKENNVKKTIMSESQIESTRKISEELVDNMSIEDIPAYNFFPNEDNNMFNFSSFGVLKNPENLVSFDDASEVSQRLVDEMEDENIEVSEQEIIPVTTVETKHHFGFTSTHLILLISFLSSIILLILGIFLISWY